MPSSDSTIPIVVVDADEGTRNRLALQLGEATLSFDSVRQLDERLDGSPMVLVLGPSCTHMPGLLGAERLVQAHREVGAILVADGPSPKFAQRARRSGIREVLAAPTERSVLKEAVRRVVESLASPGVGMLDVAGGDGGSGDGGTVITVFSAKGGSGKSVVASNLAVVLAGRSERPVCLVDANLQFGDIAVMLKLTPAHTIVDVVGSIDHLDAARLQSYLTRHPASGLLVLAAPEEPAFADQVGADQMHQIIVMLRAFCDYVVVDTPAYFNDVVLRLMEDSDEVLMVAGMDIPNIKNVKIGLQTLRLLDTPMSKVHLVLNRSDSRVRLAVDDVERTLQLQAECLIPSDIAVPQSVNKGVPVVTDSPRTGVAKAIEQLADIVAPALVGNKRRK